MDPPHDVNMTFGRRHVACLCIHLSEKIPVVHGQIELDLHTDNILL